MPIAAMMGSITSSPARPKIMPPPTAASIAVCTARRTASILPDPMFVAMVTLAPRLMPVPKLTTKLHMAPQLPTAAMALVPANCPSTATSAALKSCCKNAISATGMAKRTILSQRDPCVISTFTPSAIRIPHTLLANGHMLALHVSKVARILLQFQSG